MEGEQQPENVEQQQQQQPALVIAQQQQQPVEGSEEETKVPEATGTVEGQQSTVQSEEEKTEVGEAMKSMEEGQHSMPEPAIKKEEEKEVSRSVEEGQHSMQVMKGEEEVVAEAVRAAEERQQRSVENKGEEEEEQQLQQPENVEQQPVLENVEQHQPVQDNVEQQHQEEQQPVLENVEQQQPVQDNVEQEQQHHQEQQHQHYAQEIFEVEEEDEINVGEAIRVMEAGCASWIVEMEEILDNNSWSVVQGHGKKLPSIYRVPDRIKRGNAEAYQPKLVSMGPLHYGEADLMPMEQHKKDAVLQRIKRFGKPLVEYVASIQEVADELLGEYDNLDEKWRTEGRDEFVQMMVKDGCFLLESLQRYFDYPPGNPVFSYHGCHTLYAAIQSDIVLMENQLPLLVLHTLLAVERDTTPMGAVCISWHRAEVNAMVLGFLGFPDVPYLDSLGRHPLDLFHKGLCGPNLNYVDIQWDGTMPSAAELTDAGIRFKSSKSHFLHDIHFKNGVLSMPVFEAHHDTEKHVLNLLAFEKLYPCAGHEVLSYMCFMDNLVNSGRDVELLRAKGVIKNLLRSDKELAQLINSLGRGAVMTPFSRLEDVQRMVTTHCQKPWNRWRATFAHTYLRNPWVFFSLLAAVILLVAAIVQTVYTVVPYYHKS